MSSEVGIIGFGRCGRLAARLLSETRVVVATDRRDLSAEAAAIGIEWVDLERAASRPHVLLAVPIRALPEVLDDVAPHLAEGALVVDLCSVKVRPMEWMAERLPPHVRRVGTHPLFGPDSSRERGVAGQRIAICAPPGGEEAAVEVTRAAEELGLEPVRIDPVEHDRRMAHSQALVFLVARALRRARIDDAGFGTPSERRVFSAFRLIEADSDELYEDILRLNPFAGETTAALVEALRAELERLGR